MDNPNVEATEQELIGGKFKTTDDLLKSYQELEKRLGTGVNEVRVNSETEAVPPAEAAPESTEAAPPADDPYGEGIRSVVSAAGLDIDAVAKEYEENGDLKPETRETLNGVFGKAMVDNYFNGLTAQAGQQQQDETQGIIAAAGGDEAWGNIQAWANDGAESELVELYNSAVDSGDSARIKGAVIALRYGYEAKNGSVAPRSARDGFKSTPQASGVEGFQSREQMLSAIRDPKYSVDSAYRKLVADRMAKTTWLDVTL